MCDYDDETRLFGGLNEHIADPVKALHFAILV